MNTLRKWLHDVSFIQEPVTVSENCLNGRNIRAVYELTYNTYCGTPIATCVVDGTECSNGTCHHELQNNTADSRCQHPVSRFSGEGVTVSVTARNIAGRSNTAVSRSISEFFIQSVVMIQVPYNYDFCFSCSALLSHACAHSRHSITLPSVPGTVFMRIALSLQLIRFQLQCFPFTGGTSVLWVHVDTTNPSNVFVECTLNQPGYICTIDYGTDPSYTNLVYRDTSSTQGRMATINLSQRLRGDTTYYYIVSAVSNSQCVRVRGRFQTGTYLSTCGPVLCLQRATPSV